MMATNTEDIAQRKLDLSTTPTTTSPSPILPSLTPTPSTQHCRPQATLNLSILRSRKGKQAPKIQSSHSGISDLDVQPTGSPELSEYDALMKQYRIDDRKLGHSRNVNFFVINPKEVNNWNDNHPPL